ncbi:MAG TPA: trypsin-like serine protease, partial [Haliangium sp.]|nr:trypsin-like serine protease [Haliangium sp.]
MLPIHLARPLRPLARTIARALPVLALILATIVAPGCAPAPGPALAAEQRPIVDGTSDTGDPSAVAIGARRVGCDERLEARCSGVLVAPRLVLTAAHCVLDPRLSSSLEVMFGSAVDAPDAAFRQVVHVAVHPEYRSDGDAADLAALILDTAAPVAPATLGAEAVDDTWTGTQVRVVGFGQARSTDLVTGVKRSGTAVITDVDAAGFRIEAAPAMSCHGDSGGPVLATRDGVEVVVGVTSTGDPGCALYGDNVRVDSFRDAFIAPWIEDAATWPTSPAADGDALVGLGDMICTADCTGDAQCPDGLVCRPEPGQGGIVNRCALPGLVAGQLGPACTSDATCNASEGADDRCVRIRADGPDACLCHVACTDAPRPERGGGCRIET